ncbi:hypothetical protein Bca101_075309 [Brassica carinata]
MKFLKHFPVLASLNLSSDQPPDIEEKHVAVVLARDLEELWESGDVFPVRADGIFEPVVPNGMTWLSTDVIVNHASRSVLSTITKDDTYLVPTSRSAINLSLPRHAIEILILSSKARYFQKDDH